MKPNLTHDRPSCLSTATRITANSAVRDAIISYLRSVTNTSDLGWDDVACRISCPNDYAFWDHLPSAIRQIWDSLSEESKAVACACGEEAYAIFQISECD